MEIAGVYNPITDLMELTSQDVEETSAKEAKEKAASSKAKSSKSSGDDVTLSEESLGLGSVLSGMTPGMSALDALDEKAGTLREHFLSALSAKFEELGVDMETHVTLKREKDGSVTVANNHPDKETIEALFQETPVLAEAFNSLADREELSRAIKSNRSVTFARMGGLAAYLGASQTSSSGFEDFFMSLGQGVASTYFSSE